MARREAREHEDKYDLPADWAMPDLTVLVGPDGEVRTLTVRMTSTYLDTAGHDLLRHGLTLRRRTGERDAGWQLKVPEDGARTELHFDAGTGRGVPAEIRNLLAGVRMGGTLRPIARLDTERLIHELVTPNGTPESATVLAEVVDDRVTASVPGDVATVRAWREVEVELVDGTEDVLAAAGRRLRKSGARRARVGSKLLRALGPQDIEPAPPKTVGGAVQTYLDAQYERIVRGDLDLRRGRPVVHQTRVAIRRYRSVLRVFAIFDPARAQWMDTELSWYADLLGAVRDCEVLRVHLTASLAELPEGVDTGRLHARLTAALDARETAARAVLTRAMNGRRYLALLRELNVWHLDAPTIKAAHRSRGGLADDAKAALATFEKRLRRARGADGTDEQLHRARKAAKRARYAYEVATPSMGKAAKRTVRELKRRQDDLGQHQDGVVALDFLAGLAARPAGDVTDFGLGVLWAAERARVS